jgi:glycosyltransferase involved in cell wall biosynthesis
VFQAYIDFSPESGRVMLQGWFVGVVIPARNEQDSIRNVLETLPEFVDVAVVVDDASVDSTSVEAQHAQTTCKLELINGLGKGVGAAIDTGHQHLIATLSEPFVSVVVAGDGQMNPDDMKGLIQPILSQGADHVKGNRRIHHAGYQGMPILRKGASAVLGLFTTLASGQRIQDPQCGYTATSSTLLKAWNWERTWEGYGYPNFWLINLAKEGWRIAERPVESIYRGEYSGIKPWSFFLRVGWMMAIEHHRRTLSWLKQPSLLPYTLPALLVYVLGWSALLPSISNDLEDFLVRRGLPPFILALCFWSIAHVFDRLATRRRRELRHHAKT